MLGFPSSKHRTELWVCSSGKFSFFCGKFAVDSGTLDHELKMFCQKKSIEQYTGKIVPMEGWEFTKCLLKSLSLSEYFIKGQTDQILLY